MELRPIDRTDRGRNRLNAALSIYRDTILPEAQNPERQILYWIEHSKAELADEFRCFAIQHSVDVVGYLQYSFFREEHIFFFEYLCLREPRSRGLVPSDAVKVIEDFLAQTYPPDFTIVFEVAHKRDSLNQWHSDTKLVKYFQRLGFRCIDFRYRYPILQSYDGETSYPADLLVMLPKKRTSVTSSEMRTILRCLYFKHYLRWDRPFLDSARFGERERLIDQLYSDQVLQTGDNDTFNTAGDQKRSEKNHFANRQPPLKALLNRLFSPKLPRLIVVIATLLFAQRVLGSVWLLLPFIPAVAAVYCLAEDTAASRKLFVTVLSRMKFSRQRS